MAKQKVVVKRNKVVTKVTKRKITVHKPTEKKRCPKCGKYMGKGGK